MIYKRHITQMQPGEIRAISDRVASLRVQIKSNNTHLLWRMARKGILSSEIETTAKRGNLIELNTNGNDLRAVLRDTEVAIVISLITGEIITAWRNDKADQHSSIRMTEYNWVNSSLPVIVKICKTN